jgi:segregation and condensation protein B
MTLYSALRALSDGNDDAERRFAHGVRVAEALLFAASTPLAEADIARMMPQGVACAEVLDALEKLYRTRGIVLVKVAEKWMFRTAPDLGYLLAKDGAEPKKLTRAALETLSIIAYHQPVTRAEIEDWRGVSTNKGTLDLLLDAGFIRMRGRRRSPGKPVTYGTTEEFLIQFGLNRIDDLPGLEELAGTGMVDAAGGRDFLMPLPSDDPTLRGDEDALEEDIFDLMAEERLESLAEEAPLNPDGEEEPPPSNEAETPPLPAPQGEPNHE